MNLGLARTIAGYHNFLHIIKLGSYEQSINNIQDSLNSFNDLDELKDSINITNAKLQNLNSKFKTIKPNNRNKRGIINGLGSAIKFITGNMDAKDAEILDSQIKNLTDKQNNLNSEINRMILVNNGMIDRFNNITNHINVQQNAITTYLKYYKDQVGNQINTNRNLLKHIQCLNQINYNIDLLTNHLTDLGEAIVLARLNIISKQILNEDEMHEIHKNLVLQGIDLKSNEQIYQFLGLQAFYTNSNLIFNIKIPILSQENYTMTHLIPLPVNNTKIILTKPYLIHNPKRVQYFDEPCQKVETMYYCKESPNQEDINNSLCVGKLIQFMPAQCELIEEVFPPGIIQPEPNYILLTNIPETQINSTCKNKAFKIKGNKLIHFENCRVTINNMIYFDKIGTFWDEIHIRTAPVTTLSPTYTIKDLKLQRLESYHVKNTKAIEILKATNVKNNYIIFSATSINLVLVVFILANVIIQKLNRRESNLQSTTKKDNSHTINQE